VASTVAKELIDTTKKVVVIRAVWRRFRGRTLRNSQKGFDQEGKLSVRRRELELRKQAIESYNSGL
jgi:hypothetical protein